ncbi:hypothetical protein V6N12_017870 [Hibiscus sabdariffa]|uniref:PB1 domain-containing protein n=1 Tax=Hibiscus sabdariffa TaxID=183260 RepID=A0ABR2AKQ8_9ROSI
MGVWMSLAYSHYAFWPIWCIPVSFYCFLPQLALANQVSIFPKVLEPLFFVYVFLVLGAYARFPRFRLGRRWWNAQRLWMIRGLTCFLFGSVDYMLKSIGIAAHGFSLRARTPGSNGQALEEDRLLRVRTSNRELISRQNGLSPDMNKGEEVLREDMISFPISLSSGIMQLKEKVAKMQKLEVSTSDIEYLDDDNRRVLIACVSDLQECLDVSRSGSNIVKQYVHNIMANLGSSCESSGELWLGCI